MRLAVISPIWRRKRLTRLMLGLQAQVKVPGVELVFCAAQSPEDPDYPHVIDGWHMVDVPNLPRGRKENAALQLARTFNPDAVVHTSSDDYLNARYFEYAAERIKEGYDLVKIESCFFYSTRRQELIYMHSLDGIGLGTCVSRRILDRLEWQLWEPDVYKVDASMFDRVWPLTRTNAAIVKDIQSEGIFAIDIKDQFNVVSYEELAFAKPNQRRYQCRVMDPDLLKSELGDVGKELLNWNILNAVQNL